MRHKVNKLTFHKGHKANKALKKKLMVNFIKYGHIDTTYKRAKILKKLIDKMVYKAIRNQPSDRNALLKNIDDLKVVRHLTDKVGPIFKGRVGGYVRVHKKRNRVGDDALIAQMTWVDAVPAIIKQDKKTKIKQSKDTKKQLAKNDKKVDK